MNERSGSLIKTFLNSGSKQETKLQVDKKLQTQYIHNIFEYIMHFDCIKIQPTSEDKILKSFSIKFFFMIFHELLSKLDPNIMKKHQFMEEHYLFMIRYMGYPYNLPNKFITNECRFPAPFICLLNWMVELLKYKKDFIDCSKSPNEENISMKELIENYILKSYLYNEEEKFQKTSELIEK